MIETFVVHTNKVIMSNPDMVTDIKKAPIELDFSTDCGKNMCNTKIKWKCLYYGKEWFDEKRIGNI